MSPNKKRILLQNGGILWRFTGINVLLLSVLILTSSLVIYNTACFLVEQTNVDSAKQTMFRQDFSTVLFWISPVIITAGSILYFSIMKKMIRPIQELEKSTKVLQHGQYPNPIKVSSNDEIGDLTRNFNKMIYYLQKNEHARDKMLTDMAHELRTPLSTINGYLEGLKNGVIEGSPSLYDSLHKESERLIHMINQLNQWNEWNFSMEQHSFNLQETRIDKLIYNTLSLFRYELEKKGISYDVNLDKSTLFIGEKGIQQVLINLFQNAIQHYNGDGKIKVVGKQLQTNYLVSVSGPGAEIPSEEKDWIFERFYKVDQARFRQAGGTGLGLAIAKEIVVKFHGGNIGLDSKGNEHTFWFTIPRMSDEFNA